MTQTPNHPPKTLTIGGLKGGGGKSTIATSFACLAAAQGTKVLLVDADDLETSYDFTVLRDRDHPSAPSYDCLKLRGNGVRSEIQTLGHEYDQIIIDAGGRDTVSQRAALSVSDAFLSPFIPRGFDLWTLERVEQLITEFRAINPDLLAYTILNRADPANQGADNAKAIAALVASDVLTYLDMPISNRKAYGQAAELGLAVTELTRYRNKAANAEITTLFQRYFNLPSTLQAAGQQ